MSLLLTFRRGLPHGTLIGTLYTFFGWSTMIDSLIGFALGICLFISGGYLAFFASQVGLPMDKAQYVHRLGRTARAGKGGHGVLLLCDFETVREEEQMKAV